MIVSNENVYSYSVVKNSGAISAMVYSTYSENQELCGDLYAAIDETTAKISKTKGDYDNIRAISYNKSIYGVCTKYENRQKEILFFEGKENAEILHLTPQGKYDNPEIVAHDDKLFVFWENADKASNYIEYVTIHIDTGEISRTEKLTNAQENAYLPKAVSDGRNLYLAYEAFFNNRYHIIFRILGERKAGIGENIAESGETKTKFSEEIDAGFESFNDTSVSLFEKDGDIYYCFENSSPLYTDYEWISPDNAVVTMPSFGHGWRVKATTGIRKVRVENNKVIIEKLTCAGTEISLVREEGSGEATVFVHMGILYIAYLEKAHHTYWKLALEYFNGSAFEAIETEEILFEQRIKPVISLDDKINIINCITENGKKVLKTSKLSFVKTNPTKIAYMQLACIDLDVLMSCSKKSPTSTEGESMSPPILKKEKEKRETIDFKGEKLGLFWGDLHMHSNISGCSLHKKFHCTELEQKHRFSKDVGRLDFNLLTDHEGMSDFQWNRTKKYAHSANLNHSFVSFVGFEWTSSMLAGRKNYGHYNVLYKDDGDIRRIHTGEYDTVEKLWNSLEKGQALTIPHHPSDECHPLDWNYFNPDFEPLVEIYQVRGSYECDDCLMKPENYGRTTIKNNSVQTGLNKGYRFGFTSGGEHEGVGITGVFARELTREGIFEALRNRRTYGTTSEKIFVDFKVNGELFGGVVQTKENSLELSIAVKGTDTIKSLTLVSNLGEKELTLPNGSLPEETITHEKTSTQVEPKEKPIAKAESIGEEIDEKSEKTITEHFEKMPDWIYLRVVQDDGNMAWTSPVWIEKIR